MHRFGEEYQRSHDIDWFARIGSIRIHAMSFGGLLPSTIDRYNNTKLLYAAYRNEPDIENLIYNEEYINMRVDRMSRGGDMSIIRDKYLRHFTEMASRGFFSFDRSLSEDNRYHLIVRPAEICELKFDGIEFPIMSEDNLFEIDDKNMTFTF